MPIVDPAALMSQISRWKEQFAATKDPHSRDAIHHAIESLETELDVLEQGHKPTGQTPRHYL